MEAFTTEQLASMYLAKKAELKAVETITKTLATELDRRLGRDGEVVVSGAPYKWIYETASTTKWKEVALYTRQFIPEDAKVLVEEFEISAGSVRTTKKLIPYLP